MFSRQLTHAGHTRNFVITALHADGWEVRVEEDSRVLRRNRYTDWHRLERALASIEREVATLTELGWRMTAAATSGAGQSTNR
jgi:hypothetical protein